MKTLSWILACASVALLAVQAADDKPVKLSDVPQDIRKHVEASAKGAPATYYKRPGVFWRADFDRNGKPMSLVITTEENVVDGKTNVMVARFDTVARKIK